MAETYKIGYIDEDVQQVKKFKRNLRPFGFTVVGYEFHKNMKPESLMAQVYESDIDLLMIDYKLRDSNKVAFNGDVIESLIYENKPLFPHIIFTSDTDQAEEHVEDLKIIFDKGDVFSDENDDDEDDDDDPAKLAEPNDENSNLSKFVRMLRGSIDQYRSYVARRKTRLADLLKKGDAEGLSAPEKNEILTLQSELNHLDKSKEVEIPKQLLTEEKLEQIARTRKEAEDFLNALINKNK